MIAAYQRLWSRPLWSDTTGSASARSVASRAHRAAVKAGWVSPLAWDNIDDPNERPAGIGDPTQTRNRGNQIGRKNYLDESVIERRINGDRTARVNTLEATEIVRRLYREGRTGTWIRVHIGLKPERYLTLAAFHAELQKKQEAA